MNENSRMSVVRETVWNDGADLKSSANGVAVF